MERCGGAMAVAIKLDLPRGVSDEDLRALSERNPGYQFERTARGELMVSPTGSEGGRRSGEVFLQLGAWNRAFRLGVIFGRPGRAHRRRP